MKSVQTELAKVAILAAAKYIKDNPDTAARAVEHVKRVVNGEPIMDQPAPAEGTPASKPATEGAQSTESEDKHSLPWVVGGAAVGLVLVGYRLGKKAIR
jgi:hypothetical protein